MRLSTRLGNRQRRKAYSMSEYKKSGLYHIISVIPARGGSKALPNKNIIPLDGKPLLNYSIEASLGSKYVDTTVVSTDYESIRQIALSSGAEAPFLRPAELATDHAHSPDAVEHAVRYYEEELSKSHDIVIMLQPTSPLRTSNHIDESIERYFEDALLDSLISVKKQHHPPWWMFTAEENRLQTTFNYMDVEDVFMLERQEFPTVYAANGAVFVVRRQYLRETGSLVNAAKNGFYIMSDEDSVDIDTQTDLDLAEIALRRRKELTNGSRVL